MRRILAAELLADNDEEDWENPGRGEGGSGGGGTGGVPGCSQRSKRRRGGATAGPIEDRRYGIYDRRRYSEAAGVRNGPGAGGRQLEMIAGGATSGGARGGEGELPSADGRQYGERSGSGGRGVGSHIGGAAVGGAAHGNDGRFDVEDLQDDGYVVDCPCGAQHDDGKLMIECERCETWAHADCLVAQMVSPCARLCMQ